MLAESQCGTVVDSNGFVTRLLCTRQFESGYWLQKTLF